MSCSAVCCPSRTTKGGVKDPELSFHTFPKCPETRNKWVKAVRRKNWEPNHHSRLCSKHFEKSCYIIGLQIRKLKSDAIPTIFEEQYCQLMVKKRKPPNERDAGLVSSRFITMEVPNVNVDIHVSPRREINVLTALSNYRVLASRRLRVIKRFREHIRKLEKKNTNLMNIINDLKKKQTTLYYL